MDLKSKSYEVGSYVIFIVPNRKVISCPKHKLYLLGKFNDKYKTIAYSLHRILKTFLCKILKTLQNQRNIQLYQFTWLMKNEHVNKKQIYAYMINIFTISDKKKCLDAWCWS